MKTIDLREYRKEIKMIYEEQEDLLKIAKSKRDKEMTSFRSGVLYGLSMALGSAMNMEGKGNDRN